jgi:hypothetical protein
VRGGAAVHLTYARGLARRASGQRRNSPGQPGCLHAVALDVLSPLSSETLHLLADVDLVFYFATPTIFRKRSRAFNPALLEDFMRFYVERFYVLCDAVQSVATRSVRVFYPSSVAVETRPKA